MISCKGKGWTGKKYTEKAYFPAISGNSGAQKGRALIESSKASIFSYIPYRPGFKKH
jgi:hypothetical protein